MAEAEPWPRSPHADQRLPLRVAHMAGDRAQFGFRTARSRLPVLQVLAITAPLANPACAGGAAACRQLGLCTFAERILWFRGGFSRWRRSLPHVHGFGIERREAPRSGLISFDFPLLGHVDRALAQPTGRRAVHDVDEVLSRRHMKREGSLEVSLLALHGRSRSGPGRTVTANLDSGHRLLVARSITTPRSGRPSITFMRAAVLCPPRTRTPSTALAVALGRPGAFSKRRL